MRPLASTSSRTANIVGSRCLVAKAATGLLEGSLLRYRPSSPGQLNGPGLRARWKRSEPARSAARLDSFRELANSPASGSMRNFVPYGDDNGDRPFDDLEQRHQCEPGVPGKPFNRVRFRNGCSARLGVPRSHASYDQDAPVRGLRRLSRWGCRLPTSRSRHVLERITAVWRRQARGLTIPRSVLIGAHQGT